MLRCRFHILVFLYRCDYVSPLKEVVSVSWSRVIFDRRLWSFLRVENKMSSNDILINDTISDDEVVLSYFLHGFCSFLRELTIASSNLPKKVNLEE